MQIEMKNRKIYLRFFLSYEYLYLTPAFYNQPGSIKVYFMFLPIMSY